MIVLMAVALQVHQQPGQPQRDLARRRHHQAVVLTKADNSRGPGGPTGPLGTPFRTPDTLFVLTKTH